MRPTAGDAAVLALGAALVGALFAAYWQPPAPAALAEVRAGGTLVGRYALDRERELQVDGRLGRSRVALGEGRARFVEAPCRNQVCVHRGWLRHDGDVAACLPNGLTLTLLGGGASRFDALSY